MLLLTPHFNDENTEAQRDEKEYLKVDISQTP